MSLEEALNRNTAMLQGVAQAIVEACELISKSKDGATPAEKKSFRANEETVAAKEATKKPAPKKAAPAEDTGDDTDEDAAINYEKDVRPKIIGFAEVNGRPAIEAIFKEFKVKNGTGLKPAQYQKFLDRLEEGGDDSDLG